MMDHLQTVEKVIEIAERLRGARDAIGDQVGELSALAEQLAEEMPLYVDVIDQMPVNPQPTDPEAWWMRKAEEIQGITIHHTLSHNPRDVARYVIEKKGRPTLPYHFWVTLDGVILLCVPLESGMWHDHTGHQNVNISVGMAGHLHKVRPPLEQLTAVVDLVQWLMEQYGIPLEQVQGHNDRYAGTVCPGWDMAGWRERFYSLLREEIGEPF